MNSLRCGRERRSGLKSPIVPVVKDCNDSRPDEIRCGHIRAAEESEVPGVPIQRQPNRKSPRRTIRNGIGNVHCEIPDRGNPTESESEVYGIRSHSDLVGSQVRDAIHVCRDINVSEHGCLLLRT